MIRKKIVALTLALFVASSSLLYGCGSSNTKEDVENAGDNVKDSAENAGEAVKDAGEAVVDGTSDIISKIKDNTMTYNEENFKADLEKASSPPSEIINGEKSFFSVDADTFVINNQNVLVYEYKESDKNALESDLKTISNNGMTINGKDTNFKNPPHIYKKGRIVVVYDGEDNATLTTLENLLGTPILG